MGTTYGVRLDGGVSDNLRLVGGVIDGGGSGWRATGHTWEDEDMAEKFGTKTMG